MREVKYDKKRSVIGIDLHGTLLNRDWSVSEILLPELIDAVNRVRSQAYIFICSGNDFCFTREVLPAPLFNIIDGYILENGCLFSDGNEERLLVNSNQIKIIKFLEKELQKMDLPDLLFFAHRRATISLFTKDHREGNLPDNLFEYLSNILQKHHLSKEITITHSDVAVDILPAGNSKFSGISRVCPEQNIIAIADSCNDWEFLYRATESFLPQNCSPYIVNRFEKRGFSILPVEEYRKSFEKRVYRSSYSYTEGVLDILVRLADSL